MYSYNLNNAYTLLQKKASGGHVMDLSLRKEAGLFDPIPGTGWIVNPKVNPTAGIDMTQLLAELAGGGKQAKYDYLFAGKRAKLNPDVFEIVETPKEAKRRGGKFNKGMKSAGVAALLAAAGYGGYKGYDAYSERKRKAEEAELEALRERLRMESVRDGEDMLKHIGIGAGIGSVGGASLAALLSKKHHSRNAFLGALGGATLGALGGYGYDKLSDRV